MAVCVICKGGKGRRACPLKGGLICPVCCAEVRTGGERGCPDECRYLKVAREYEASVKGARQPSLNGKEFTDTYMDVLQNIEFAIMDVVRERGDIEDRDIRKALEYLIPRYGEGERGNDGGKASLSPGIRALVDSIVSIIEFRRENGMPRTSDEEVEMCLKKILSSVLLHGERTGSRTGYIDFIDQFIR